MKPKRGKSCTVATTVVVAVTLQAGRPLRRARRGRSTTTPRSTAAAGAMKVGSGADLWSSASSTSTPARSFKPVASYVSGEGFAVDENKKGEPKKNAVDCSYSDGVATGTVTVKKA